MLHIREVPYDIAFQRSILIFPGLLDVLFPMTGLILFLVCSPLVTVRRRLGDQLSRRSYRPKDVVALEGIQA